jgi:hypothetical protein
MSATVKSGVILWFLGASRYSRLARQTVDFTGAGQTFGSRGLSRQHLGKAGGRALYGFLRLGGA